MRSTGPALWLGALLLLAAGCGTPQYQRAKAVERAREYLVEHAPELTPEELFFVRYNDPVLLTAPVLGDTNMPGDERLSSEQMQICVTWKFPDRDEYYMVYGVSPRSMTLWRPKRLIRRTWHQQPVSVIIGAENTARKYAQNYLWRSLDVDQYNLIRFSNAWVLKTDFELNFNPEGKLTPEEVAKAKAEAAKKVQYSLVWKPQIGPWLVFAGLSTPELGGWSVNFAGTVTPEEVQQHTLEVMRDPARPEENTLPKTEKK